MDSGYRGQEGYGAIAHTSTAGLSPSLLNSLIQRYSIWNESFEQRCHRVLNLKVKDCMCTPHNGDVLVENDLLEVAIHKLATGPHRTLLVIGGNGIVGIFRLTDVFDQIVSGSEGWR